MMTSEDRRRAFDDVADLYDRFRPSYPIQLVDDVETRSRIPRQGDLLEIGCGTGQATVAFATRGHTIVCLEPGRNLARIAARNLSTFSNVRIEECTFEDWSATDSSADLIIAAQSFHLVDPTVGVPKVARTLRPGGAIAIFSNRPLRGTSEVAKRVQQAYARYAPGLQGGWQEPRLDAIGLFDTVFTAQYTWQSVYTAAEYVGLMETQSPHRLLPFDQRAALLAAIREAIASLGGSITIEYVAHLWLATRAAAA